MVNMRLAQNENTITEYLSQRQIVIDFLKSSKYYVTSEFLAGISINMLL